MKLWQGRLSGETPVELDALNNSIRFDQRLYPQDIRGSIAHARMLGAQGIIATDEAEKIIAGLESILSDLDVKRLSIDPKAEDIHTFVEAELIRRIGDMGKKLHTGRSRNDQVATDLRLYLRDEVIEIRAMLATLCETLESRACECREMLMPGYTHLQRAQPVTFGHQLSAYRDMILRDDERLADCLRRLNHSPLGAGALAGSTFLLDRQVTAEELGFDVVGDKLFLRLFEMVRRSARSQGFLALTVQFCSQTQIHADRDHVAVIVFLEPGDNHSGIQTATVGKNHFLRDCRH